MATDLSKSASPSIDYEMIVVEMLTACIRTDKDVVIEVGKVYENRRMWHDVKAAIAILEKHFESEGAEPPNKCTCPTEVWAADGSDMNESTCELTEAEHPCDDLPRKSAEQAPATNTSCDAGGESTAGKQSSSRGPIQAAEPRRDERKTPESDEGRATTKEPWGKGVQFPAALPEGAEPPLHPKPWRIEYYAAHETGCKIIDANGHWVCSVENAAKHWIADWIVRCVNADAERSPLPSAAEPSEDYELGRHEGILFAVDEFLADDDETYTQVAQRLMLLVENEAAKGHQD